MFRAPLRISPQIHSQLIALLLLCFSFSFQSAYAEDEDPNAVDDTPTYYELTPQFIVNLQDTGKRVRFLQARIQVLGRGKSTIETVKMHDAPIRDALITLLSSKKRSDINTTQKKKKLQEEAKKVVEGVMKEMTGKPQIDGLYFTNFVVQ